MRNISVFIIGLASALLIFGCEYTAFEAEELPEVSEDVSFAEDVEPIFDAAGCTDCHNGGQSPDLTTGNAYNSLTSNPDYVDLSSDDNIYTVAAPENSHFKNYTSEQAALVKAWLEQGAPNN
mgnify:CR=1 FL=1